MPLRHSWRRRDRQRRGFDVLGRLVDILGLGDGLLPASGRRLVLGLLPLGHLGLARGEIGLALGQRCLPLGDVGVALDACLVARRRVGRCRCRRCVAHRLERLEQGDAVILGDRHQLFGGRADLHDPFLDDHLLDVVGGQHAHGIGALAEVLDGILDRLQLVIDGVAHGLGPVEMVVHLGQDRGVAEQAVERRIPVLRRLERLVLLVALDEPVGLDDVDREQRCLQDHREQRVGKERHRRHERAHLVVDDHDVGRHFRRRRVGCWVGRGGFLRAERRR